MGAGEGWVGVVFSRVGGPVYFTVRIMRHFGPAQVQGNNEGPTAGTKKRPSNYLDLLVPVLQIFSILHI